MEILFVVVPSRFDIFFLELQNPGTTDVGLLAGLWWFMNPFQGFSICNSRRRCYYYVVIMWGKGEDRRDNEATWNEPPLHGYDKHGTSMWFLFSLYGEQKNTALMLSFPGVLAGGGARRRFPGRCGSFS